MSQAKPQKALPKVLPKVLPRVLVAMSGGVDSSVAAAMLCDEGYEVAGVTLKLWGGPSDSGCCSVSDVDDARWVADRLGIEHHVFNFGDDFEQHVVDPYVKDHASGRTPNPCVECNRHIKFDRLMRRAEALGFDLVATGHHARIVDTPAGPRLARGADFGKDQSYVLHMISAELLKRLLLPVGDITKDEVRQIAAERGLMTAAKPDSQDVCFIKSDTGRRSFLGERIPLRPAKIVDRSGEQVGTTDAVELVTIGQRRGLGVLSTHEPRYVVEIDAENSTVIVGDQSELQVAETQVTQWQWSADTCSDEVQVQTAAHGPVFPAVINDDDHGTADAQVIRWLKPHRAVAAGQSVVAYKDDVVIGGGVAA